MSTQDKAAARTRAWERAYAIAVTAAEENRAFTTAEQLAYETHFAEFERLNSELRTRATTHRSSPSDTDGVPAAVQAKQRVLNLKPSWYTPPTAHQRVADLERRYGEWDRQALAHAAAMRPYTPRPPRKRMVPRWAGVSTGPR